MEPPVERSLAPLSLSSAATAGAPSKSTTDDDSLDIGDSPAGVDGRPLERPNCRRQRSAERRQAIRFLDEYPVRVRRFVWKRLTTVDGGDRDGEREEREAGRSAVHRARACRRAYRICICATSSAVCQSPTPLGTSTSPVVDELFPPGALAGHSPFSRDRNVCVGQEPRVADRSVGNPLRACPSAPDPLRPEGGYGKPSAPISIDAALKPSMEIHQRSGCSCCRSAPCRHLAPRVKFR